MLDKVYNLSALLKARVVDVDNTNKRYKIRIVSIHGSKGHPTSIIDSELPWATLCLGGRSDTEYPEIGDVVFVLFEGSDVRSPVIIGYLAL